MIMCLGLEHLDMMVHNFIMILELNIVYIRTTDAGSVGTDDIPLTHEFVVKRTPDTGFAQSVLKLTADRQIIFNDTGVKNFGNYKGTANISADGKLHTAGKHNF